MSDNQISTKVFPCKLADFSTELYAARLHWLRHLLDRLGRESTLLLWHDVVENYDGALLLEILSSGWSDTPKDDCVNVAQAFSDSLQAYFPTMIEGISPDEAHELVQQMPPIAQIGRMMASPNVCRDTTTYEALHIGADAIALLIEAMIRRHGRQGELIAYDVVRERSVLAEGGKTGTFTDFKANLVAKVGEPSIFTAGLEFASVAAAENEVVLHIKHCEWARYFQERHPQVGYLMACSGDEAAYRAFSENIRMQRTSTIMEGGTLCDFRIYVLEETAV